MWRHAFWTISGATVPATITAMNSVVGTAIGTGEIVMAIVAWQVVTTVSPFVVVIEVIVGFP